MRLAARPFLKFLLLLLCFALLPTNAPAAVSKPEIENILQKIESRHYRWIAIRADVILFFATSGNSRAMCGGELLYHRLDERMLLTCVDSQKNLVFAFRTLDRRFDLYLPSQNTVYHGSIFDMEDSPEIESHLKPRDLYRALKPSAIDPRHIEIGRNNLVVTNLDVYATKEEKEYLSRKLYLTPEGDVRGELYLNPEGRGVTEIQRYDFQSIHAPASPFQSIIFPKKITILSPENKKGSAIFFAKVTALNAVDPLEFLFRVPLGTKEVFLEEKDPKLAMRQLSTRGKTAPAAQKNMPIQKTDVVPLKEALPPTKVKPADAVKIEEKKQEPEPAREEQAQAIDAALDADIAPQGAATDTDESIAVSAAVPEKSSQGDPNTSLDPSVQPSTEMEALPEPEGPIVQYPSSDKEDASKDKKDGTLQ